MTHLKAGLIFSALALPFQAQAQTACETYSVVSGDTLRLIAERVFGERDLSPVIFNANRAVIGANPDNIEIGMQIAIPCAPSNESVEAGATVSVITNANAIVIDNADQSEGSAVVTIQEEPDIPVLEVETPVNELPVEEAATDDESLIEVFEPATPEIALPATPSFISAGMYPPFSDGDGSGLMTAIVREALQDDEGLDAVEINPVSLPFDPLMASADPDVVLSFPWINPGCEDISTLSERSASLCSRFEFSHKAYEIVMTFFVADRGGLAQATTASDFAGKSICVPEQYPINHLIEAGFISDDITIDRGNSVSECMSKLLSGQVDVVNADYLSVEATYAVLGSQAIIVENPSFTWIRSVHAIADKNNPAALLTLARFNAGLNRIKENGDWEEIVQPFLK